MSSSIENVHRVSGRLQQLSPFDALLFASESDPRSRGQVAMVYVLDRAPARARLVESLERASRAMIRLRQRVVVPGLPGLLPAWVVDPDFEVHRHLRRQRLRARGSMVQLLDACTAEMVRPLDLARPLWEAVLIEGLASDRAALLLKLSHAMSDGVGAVSDLAALFDVSSSARKAPMPPAPVAYDVAPEEWRREALRRLPFAATSGAVQLARDVGSAIANAWSYPRAAAAQATEFVESLQRVFTPKATGSPLLSERSLDRRCAVVSFPLAALKRAGAAAGASVNDAYLAAVTGSLRRYHESCGVEVSSLPMAVPVNLRHEAQLEAGNFFGVVQVAAPLWLADPRERMTELHRQIRDGRAESAIGAPALLAGLTARVPAPLLHALLNALPRPDVQVSNVPGPSGALYIAGAKVLAGYPLGPVPGVAAMYTMQSQGGRCFVGVTLDAAAFARRPAAVVDCLREGFGEVLRLAGGGAASIEVAAGHVLRSGAR